MAEDRTLLSHLVLKLATHPENVAVEALGHILSSSAPTRMALEDLLRAGGADTGPIVRVETQVTGEEGERPDLVGFDDCGAKRLLIEAKFWAGLTESQPVAYLRQLPQDKASALLFVAPAARSETLWPELRRRVEEAKDISLGTDAKHAGLLSATAGDGRRLMLTSWKTLLGSMASQASAVGDARADIDIQQLLGLTQQMDEDAFLPLRPDEFGPEFPRRMRGLWQVIGDASQRGHDEGWARVAGRNWMGWMAHAKGYGRAMELGGAGVWLGVDLNRWAQYRATPLWLYFQEKPGTISFSEVQCRLEPLQQEDPPGVIDVQGKHLYVPIFLPTGVEYDAVLDAVVARLKHIADLIGRDAAP